MSAVNIRKPALPVVSTARNSHPSDWPTVEQLLTAGGDARIELRAGCGSNRYGCRPRPDPDVVAFGSSTASSISERGFAAASALHRRILFAAARETPAVIYGRELHRMRLDLLQLCAAPELPGTDVIFAASGTDLHLIAAQLATGPTSRPTLAIVVDAGETGSGVAMAITGQRFSERAPEDGSMAAGSLIADVGTVEYATIPLRHTDGTPRAADSIDTEVEYCVTKAAAQGYRVLLILVDVSKTGLIAPSVACVSTLHRRFSAALQVLVDACQFRIAPATVRAYLRHGFMVAVTGSKFVSGPAFSGALLVPQAVAQRYCRQPLPGALRSCTARAEWPAGWVGTDALDEHGNFGLLLRWEAALAELRALRAVPETAVANFLHAFSATVRQRLASDARFELLPTAPLERHPLVATHGWDRIQTLFPFLLYRRDTHDGRKPLSRTETERVYRWLQTDMAGHYGRHEADAHTAGLRFQLGQPVACGTREGLPVSALRLCVSARLVTEAALENGRNTDRVIAGALAALDKAGLMVDLLAADAPA